MKIFSKAANNDIKNFEMSSSINFIPHPPPAHWNMHTTMETFLSQTSRFLK
jgi:hypothetical protein